MEGHPDRRGRSISIALPANPFDVLGRTVIRRNAQGYCISNHIHNGWSEDSPFNGDYNGIGHLRSQQTGADISASAGNRVPVKDCITDQGKWGTVSNSGK